MDKKQIIILLVVLAAIAGIIYYSGVGKAITEEEFGQICLDTGGVPFIGTEGNREYLACSCPSQDVIYTGKAFKGCN